MTTPATTILQEFVPPEQLRFLRHLCRGEEGEHFRAIMTELAERIAGMPKTYEQDGKGQDAVVYLHYFKGGCDWYITEKDMGDPDTPGQHQAYGLATLGFGAEMGYISIIELLANNVEVDLYFTPRTLRELIGARPALAVA